MYENRQAKTILTKINRSKTEIQKELSLLRAWLSFSKTPWKEEGWRLTFHLAAGLDWAGAAALATRPLHVLLPSPGRSAQLAGDSRRGESPGSGRRVGAD